MSYRLIDIQQTLATVEAKLSRTSYSNFMKKLYGVTGACGTCDVLVLTLYRFALTKWDSREGATNPFSTADMTNLIQRVNQI